jgi:hypothetical protein
MCVHVAPGSYLSVSLLSTSLSLYLSIYTHLVFFCSPLCFLLKNEFSTPGVFSFFFFRTLHADNCAWGCQCCVQLRSKPSRSGGFKEWGVAALLPFGFCPHPRRSACIALEQPVLPPSAGYIALRLPLSDRFEPHLTCVGCALLDAVAVGAAADSRLARRTISSQSLRLTHRVGTPSRRCHRVGTPAPGRCRQLELQGASTVRARGRAGGGCPEASSRGEASS